MARVIKSDFVTLDMNHVVNIEIPQDIIPDAIEIVPLEVQETPEELARRLIQEAEQEAEAIMQKAQMERDHFMNQAKKEIEELRARTEQEAYQKGLSEGYEEGSGKAQGLIKDAENELLQAKEERQRTLAAVEPEVVQLVIDIVQKLVGAETKTNPQIILHLIKQGLDQTTISGSVYIHVSKEDFDQTVKARDTIQSMMDAKTELEILADAALEKNDCIIETPFGSIDCSLGHQMSELISTLQYILEIR